MQCWTLWHTTSPRRRLKKKWMLELYAKYGQRTVTAQTETTALVPHSQHKNVGLLNYYVDHNKCSCKLYLSCVHWLSLHDRSHIDICLYKSETRWEIIGYDSVFFLKETTRSLSFHVSRLHANIVCAKVSLLWSLGLYHICISDKVNKWLIFSHWCATPF